MQDSPTIPRQYTPHLLSCFKNIMSRRDIQIINFLFPIKVRFSKSPKLSQIRFRNCFSAVIHLMGTNETSRPSAGRLSV